jgi:protein-disulfide isomerase
MMKRYLPFLIVGAVGLITLGSGAMLYRAKRPAVLTIPKESAPAPPSMHARGDTNAPVTLEEFGDFQCPPCAAVSGQIHQLEKDYGARLRVIFRHFPLVMHQHARTAALAAEAAGMQGRFWEMHDLLYKEQPVWSKATEVTSVFNSYAGLLGMDLERFKKDMASPEAKARVDSDEERGKSLGVTSTPTIFLNNRSLPFTSVNPAGLHTAIDEALKEKSEPAK